VVPPRLEPVFSAASRAEAIARRRRARARGILIAVLLSALAAVVCALALKGSLTVEGITGIRTGPPAVPAPPPPAPLVAAPLPALVPVSHDAAGSVIETASFPSPALSAQGSFLVYLPPGFGTPGVRYPVIYLLHGQNGHATAFLEVGLQPTLDHLIAAGAVAPMVAVMVQDRSTLSNWRDIGSRHSASYVVEVQELIDRMLPTLAARDARAIVGSSMGGFGAMHVALANPDRFSVVESWLGYFNNLEGELAADRPAIERLGLHAFVYGAEADHAANPTEDPWWAAMLRESGAQAEGWIYPGDHSLHTVSEHLEAMMLFAGRSLGEAQRRTATEEAAAVAVGDTRLSGEDRRLLDAPPS
jgi:S-formylglutathione hydrolase FrmB